MAEEPDDELPVDHRSPYTWLQVLGLITVAFVLGVLIYFALVQGSADASAGVASAAAALMDAATAVASPPFETGA